MRLSLWLALWAGWFPGIHLVLAVLASGFWGGDSLLLALAARAAAAAALQLTADRALTTHNSRLTEPRLRPRSRRLTRERMAVGEAAARAIVYRAGPAGL